MDTLKTNDVAADAADAADREAQERAPKPPVETSADVAAECGETDPASAAGKVPEEAGSQGGETQTDLPQSSPLSDETAPAAPDGQPEAGNEASAPEFKDADPAELAQQRVDAVEAEERRHAEAMKSSVLSGAAHQPGTTLEVSHEEAIHYLRQMAIDDMGRIWRIEENGDMVRVKMVGTLVH